MQANVHVNGQQITLEGNSTATLLDALRAAGYISVKHGCDHGECGDCAVLFDGEQVNSCHVLLAQVAGRCIQTVEGLGQVAEQGWKRTAGLHPLAAGVHRVGRDSMRLLHTAQCCWRPQELLVTQGIRWRASPSLSPRTRCARRCRACCAAAPATSSRCRRY